MSLPVADLVKTVAVLQLIPFALGIVTRRWAEARAIEWSQFALKTSNLTFLAVLAGAFLGSWDTIVDLVGSRVNLAAIAASAVVIAIGYLFAVGQASGTRQAAASTIQPGTNAAPHSLRSLIAFDGDADILGAVVAILLFQMVVGLTTAVFFAKTEHATSSNPPPPRPDGGDRHTSAVVRRRGRHQIESTSDVGEVRHPLHDRRHRVEASRVGPDVGDRREDRTDVASSIGRPHQRQHHQPNREELHEHPADRLGVRQPIPVTGQRTEVTADFDGSTAFDHRHLPLAHVVHVTVDPSGPSQQPQIDQRDRHEQHCCAAPISGS